MKNSLKLFFLIALLVVNTVKAGDVFDEIGNALRSGDAKAVSRYFGATIDLTIVNQEEVYSKIQAEQILREFFSKNTPRNFSIIHKGESKDGSVYAIGSLVTAQGVTYRTYLFVKGQGNNALIQELRFMRE